MLRNVLTATLLLVIAGSAVAHQIKSAFTQVLFNPRTQNIEVMHRFYIHDAEHAMAEIFKKQHDIIGEPSSQQAFAEYVTERFFMESEGEVLPLTLVGHEIDGKFFWVYQETAQIDNLDGLAIRHNALREIWPQQVNTINIEGKGELKTLTFDKNIELLKVSF